MSSNPSYFLNNRPAWVDLASSDPEASRNFYTQLLGWDIQVSPDPQYGGYAMAVDAGVGVAGIGPKQNPNAPSAWSLYIGTDDADALAQRVTDNGGKVAVAPFAVGDQGRMAVFQDPSGGFISAWQATGMRGFVSHQFGAFDWGELNARNVAAVLPFYEKVFGWQVRTMQSDPSRPPYNEFQMEGESILGAWEMNPMVPARRAFLLADLLQCRRRRRLARTRPPARRSRAGRTAGHARRPILDRHGPPGRVLRHDAFRGAGDLRPGRPIAALRRTLRKTIDVPVLSLVYRFAAESIRAARTQNY